MPDHARDMIRYTNNRFNYDTNVTLEQLNRTRYHSAWFLFFPFVSARSNKVSSFISYRRCINSCSILYCLYLRLLRSNHQSSLKVVSATFNKKVKFFKNLTECRYCYWKLVCKISRQFIDSNSEKKLDQILEKRNIRKRKKLNCWFNYIFRFIDH